MLHLCRMTHPYHWERCKISKQYITYGDYYYYDDEDGLIVKAEVYHRMKQKKKYDEFDWTTYNKAVSEREYEEACREKERQFLEQGLLERKVDKGAYNG